MPTDRLRAALEACKVPCPACIGWYADCPSCNNTRKQQRLPPAVVALAEAFRSHADALAAALRHELECGLDANDGCEKCERAEAALAAYDAALTEGK